MPKRFPITKKMLRSRLKEIDHEPDFAFQDGLHAAQDALRTYQRGHDQCLSQSPENDREPS